MVSTSPRWRPAIRSSGADFTRPLSAGAQRLYEELLVRQRSEYVEHIWLAAVPEWVGRRAESLDHLRQAAERREPLFMLAGRHGFYLFVPPWASLPEYQAVLRIIGE